MNDIKERRKRLESIPRSVIAYASDYADGFSTGLHDHPFAQLVYAIQGVMEVEAQGKCWMIPPGRALWVPCRIPHSVTMHGQARMRTLYVRTEQFRKALNGFRGVIQTAPPEDRRELLFPVF